MEQTINQFVNKLKISRKEKKAWKRFFREHPEMYLPLPIEENIYRIATIFEIRLLWINPKISIITDETGEIKLIWKKLENKTKFLLYEGDQWKKILIYNHAGWLVNIWSYEKNTITRYTYRNGLPHFRDSNGETTKLFVNSKGIIDYEILPESDSSQ